MGNGEVYDVLAKKYGLRPYAEMAEEFDLEEIETKEHFLKHVRKQIVNRIEFGLDILERIIQPDTNRVADMYECRLFGEEEKNGIFKLFKELMFLHRTALFVDLNDGEKADAEFIKQATTSWFSYKKELVSIASKLMESWKVSPSEKENQVYFG